MTATLELFKNLMTFSILKRELIAIDAKHVTFWGAQYENVTICTSTRSHRTAKIGETVNKMDSKWTLKSPKLFNPT